MRAVRELKELWGNDKAEVWQQMELDEQIAWVLGITKEADARHWMIAKRMLEDMWKIRSARQGLGARQTDEEVKEEDWESTIRHGRR